jgi:two-component system LytT family response regulator
VATVKQTRVFAVEDSLVFVAAIQEVLSGIPGVSLAGSAAEAELAVQEIQRLAPDVVILDLQLKSGTGIDVLRALRRGVATPPVSIVFSSCLDAACRRIFRRHGADFIVDKSENYSQLAEVIRSIATGEDGGGFAGRSRPAEN